MTFQPHPRHRSCRYHLSHVSGLAAQRRWKKTDDPESLLICLWCLLGLTSDRCPWGSAKQWAVKSTRAPRRLKIYLPHMGKPELPARTSKLLKLRQFGITFVVWRLPARLWASDCFRLSAVAYPVIPPIEVPSWNVGSAWKELSRGSDETRKGETWMKTPAWIVGSNNVCAV